MQDEGLYEICIEGRLDDRWVDWLGLAAQCEATGKSETDPKRRTRFVGRFDQSSLHACLRRLSDLGVALISLQRQNDS